MVTKRSLLLVPELNDKFVAIEAAQIVDDVAHQRFRKTIVRVGSFVKSGVTFSITREHLEHWAKTFDLMQEQDLKVPIPLLHNPDAIPEMDLVKMLSNPDISRGWVESMFVEGDELVMTADLFGEDAAELALKSRVSIKAPSVWTDGTGKKWQHPITHVALVTDPVVTKLGEWMPIAASLSEIEMDIGKLGKALGLELGEHDAHEKIVAAFEKLKGKPKLDEKSDEKKPDVSAALVSLTVKDRARDLKDLLDGQLITPAQHKTLTEQHVATEVVSLSLSQSDGSFGSIVAILKAGSPATAQTSGAQLKELSRDEKTGTTGLEDDADARAKVAVAEGAFVN